MLLSIYALPSISIQNALPVETPAATKLLPPVTPLNIVIDTLRANAAPVTPPMSWAMM